MTVPFRSVFAILSARAWTALAIVCVGAALALPGHWLSATAGSARTITADDRSASMPPGVGAPGGPPTSPDGLRGRVREMEARLVERPDDLAAAVLLADALLREARAANDGRPAGRAAVVLEAALAGAPGAYDALRLLGATDLSLHRFREALEVGWRARDMRPEDAWNYGVIGDALLELGEYDEAFASFETMMRLRPGAAAYARAAYAREITGDLDGALGAMRMALAATPPQDPEAQAWYGAQIGELLLKLGQVDEADREFRRALHVFPLYPLAMVGSGKVKMTRGDVEGALASYVEQLARTPTLDLAARIGDLHAAAGRHSDAERYYQLAEEIAGPPEVQTEAALALFLAEHDRKLPVAIAVAETVAARRHDIATDHALAWAHYKSGRRKEAVTAINRALRMGSRDETLLAHAQAIRGNW